VAQVQELPVPGAGRKQQEQKVKKEQEHGIEGEVKVERREGEEK
jgi:hypothetical protein